MLIHKKFFTYCVRILLNKIKDHTRSNQGRFVLIPITGTVGKSSMTRMISMLCEENSFRVISGTSLKKNLNSLEGFALTLLRYHTFLRTKGDISAIESRLHLSLDGASVFKKLWLKWYFVYALCIAVFIPVRLKPDEKKHLACIVEVGFDYQQEHEIYDTLFDGADCAIVTNLTYEHAQNFSHERNAALWDTLKYYIQPELKDALDAIDDNLLYNTALEQLCFIPQSQYACYPAEVGTISNSVIISTKGVMNCIPERNNQFVLGVNDTFFSKTYMLPDTMAKNVCMLDFVAEILSFPRETVQKVISSDSLFPYSRFSRLTGINHSTIVDSSYNADPASIKSMLDMLESYILYCQTHAVDTKHTLILGEMRELGEISTDQHTNILHTLDILYQKYPYAIKDIMLLGHEWLAADQTGVLKQEGSVSYVQGTFKHYKVFSRVGDIMSSLNLESIRPEDWFWIKGSQNTIFLEALVVALLADSTDSQYVCRQSDQWNKVRAPYV